MQVLVENGGRIRQGDIIKNVDYIENVAIEDGIITVNKICFPLVVVLTQDCDLTQDFNAREEPKEINNQFLLSVIVAPLYNYEHLIRGEHLSELGIKMRVFSTKKEATDTKNIRNNETPRYHYFEFDDSVPIVNSVADFKHYFSVNVQYLQQHKMDNFVCSVSELYRENISQRFANYLSRIGLPETYSL